VRLPVLAEADRDRVLAEAATAEHHVVLPNQAVVVAALAADVPKGALAILRSGEGAGRSGWERRVSTAVAKAAGQGSRRRANARGPRDDGIAEVASSCAPSTRPISRHVPRRSRPRIRGMRAITAQPPCVALRMRRAGRGGHSVDGEPDPSRVGRRLGSCRSQPISLSPERAYHARQASPRRRGVLTFFGCVLNGFAILPSSLRPSCVGAKGDDGKARAAEGGEGQRFGGGRAGCEGGWWVRRRRAARGQRLEAGRRAGAGAGRPLSERVATRSQRQGPDPKYQIDDWLADSKRTAKGERLRPPDLN
jgi:hypothetical protein